MGSKFKYAIINGNSVVGIIYETKIGLMTVMTGEKMDISQGLSIRDYLGTKVSELDLIEVISEIIPKE